MTPQPVDPNELRAANCTAERFTHMLIDLDDTLYQVPSMPAEVLQRIQGEHTSPVAWPLCVQLSSPLMPALAQPMPLYT